METFPKGVLVLWYRLLTRRRENNFQILIPEAAQELRVLGYFLDMYSQTQDVVQASLPW
jgi:hypothetical protein